MIVFEVQLNDIRLEYLIVSKIKNKLIKLLNNVKYITDGNGGVICCCCWGCCWIILDFDDDKLIVGVIDLIIFFESFLLGGIGAIS